MWCKLVKRESYKHSCLLLLLLWANFTFDYKYFFHVAQNGITICNSRYFQFPVLFLTPRPFLLFHITLNVYYYSEKEPILFFDYFFFVFCTKLNTTCEFKIRSFRIFFFKIPFHIVSLHKISYTIVVLGLWNITEYLSLYLCVWVEWI